MLATGTPSRRLPLETYVSRGAALGVKWTALREAVLRLIWSAAEPLGAYEAADRLGRGGRRVHPTSVYRCLHCLVDAGLVLHVVTWKRYVIAPDPALSLWAALLCRGCGSCTLLDLSARGESLDRKLSRREFDRRVCSAECEGLCRGCSAGSLAA
jgi:Fur family zinc uptake transcriptional regulator